MSPSLDRIDVAGNLRYIAVDWSGAVSQSEQRKRIVAADWHAGTVTLTRSRTRVEMIAWLLEQARLTPALAVGLDFAFSYPAWFVKQLGASTIEDFWRIATAHGEDWLSSCKQPFWGRPGTRCPADHRAPQWLGYRIADRSITTGRQPSSPFQIGGAGAVGTGSMRGIPWLLELKAAGFSIWPFDEPKMPMVMEIYPRSFTGPVNKSSRTERAAYVRLNLGAMNLNATTIQLAIESEDAFDALCSAIGMAQQRRDIANLRQADEAITKLEGAIFPGRRIEPGMMLTPSVD